MSGVDVNLVLRSTRVVTPEGTRPAAVAVAGGTIDAVLPYDADVPAGARLEDFGDDVLLPGLVDTHVHVNDPGRTEWEGFWTATRAAAAGGITTLLDMPLNSLPPTTTVDHLRTKQQVAAPKAHIDTGFWGGAIPSNVKDLRPLYEAGVFGFKCFLSPSGVEEFPELDQEQLARSMAEIAGFGGLLIVHAEDPHHLADAPQRPGPAYADFLASRPRDAENTAIEGLIAHAKRLNARVHVLHLKCCPPIREAANQDILWAGLADGTIDCIVSDHSPCTTDLKTPDFASAWGGISSLQLGLPAIWTEARRRGHSLDDVARWMSAAPAELAGLTRKGAIEAGRDADFAVLAPEATFTVDPAELFHRNQVTAYAGKTLHGVVRSSWLRGVRIASDGVLAEPTGRLLERDR
ncbi:amidohydrolase family protein [Streptomyces mediolani]|uniref:amidohydrolase family protein n=1 Tax=Streptomyces mediolani TaxID=68237 RepID=UPI0004C8C49B|nr:amidohydrolase family protein [Streptomyces mediolani]